jgi:peptide chain release factor 2
LRLNEVNAALENPNVWNDPKRAQELGREKKTLDTVVGTIDHLASNLADNTELYDMSKADADFDGLAAIEAEAATLRETVEQLEFRRMFNNPADPSNCFIDIQAGAGGTEACDWASMLLRQYLKYCERKGFKAEVMEETEGDVAGIRSATIKVEGEYAFGLLRTETGVHRLVRKSPFDSSGGRHTSFASLFGLNMMLTAPQGGVHADADVCAWMRDAGFEATRVQALPPPMPHRVVFGSKA